MRRILLASASTLLVLLLGEVAARAVETPQSGATRVAQWREYDRDVDLGWAPRPGGTHVLRRGEVEIRETSNGLRLLGPETTRAKPPGTFRVLVLGDSIAEGLEVLPEERATADLSARLRSDGRAAEVLNAGRTGYQTDQQVLFYERDARTMDADLVVLVVFLGNDVIGNTMAENEFGTAVLPKPRFDLVGGGLMLEPVGTAASDGRSLGRSPIDDLKAWTAERSALYRAARSAWERVLLATGPRRVPEVWEVFRRKPTSRIDHAWAVTAALLSRLRDDVERDDARLLVVVIPDERQVSEGKWRDFLAFYGLRADEWDRDGAHRRLDAICAAERLACVQMIDRLRAAPSDPYLPRGGHLNPAGHALVGDAIHSWIVRRLAETW